MPIPRFCSNPACPNHSHPLPGWRVRFGHYHCRAHGRVQRYRCRTCRRTLSDQSESLHFFAKRHLPLAAIWACLLSGASLREIARRYHLSSTGIRSALLRLGRQAMAAHLLLLAHLYPRTSLVVDGLRSFLTSQDFPCDLTTVVDAPSQMILGMTHSMMRRGGSMRQAQRLRLARKLAVWKPQNGALKADISLLFAELWDYLRPAVAHPAVILTDQHPLYRSLLDQDPLARHFRMAQLFLHRRLPSTSPRTPENPLFPVNYVDRLLRHRLKEHTRETFAFGRNATLQMHRAWIFAFDHNCRREYRVRQPQRGSHAEQGVVDRQLVHQLVRQLFTRRILVHAPSVPQTIRRVWMAELPTPPVRWRVGQKGATIRVPRYAQADLLASYQHAA